MEVAERIANAMTRARDRLGMTTVQFARELHRLVPGVEMSGEVLEAMEGGRWTILAEHLVAAACIADQPVSALLGEMELFTVTIPQLERRLLALESQMDERRRTA